MNNRTFSTLILAVVLSLCAAASSKADIIVTLGPFDQPADFSGNYPLSPVTLGTFAFTIPNSQIVTGATISGTFGNNDIPGTTNVTADSDYFVKGTAIEVAACDSPNVATSGLSLSCDAGSTTGDPTPWTYTFTPSDLTALASSLSAGSLDFNVVQNYYGAVETGTITLDITTTPEPATVSIVALGLAGIALLRRRSN